MSVLNYDDFFSTSSFFGNSSTSADFSDMIYSRLSKMSENYLKKKEAIGATPDLVDENKILAKIADNIDFTSTHFGASIEMSEMCSKIFELWSIDFIWHTVKVKSGYGHFCTFSLVDVELFNRKKPEKYVKPFDLNMLVTE